MSKSVDEMKQQRRELDRKIRAAKRVEVKAAKEAKVSAQQRLGQWLAGFADAGTAKDVEALHQRLETEQGRQVLRGLLGADTSSTESSAEAVESSDTPAAFPHHISAVGRETWR